MYGKGLPVVPTAAGVSLLPNTGDSRALFITAVALIASGVVVFVAATVLARKSRVEAE